MGKIVRNILAVLAGMIVGSAVNMGLIMLSWQIFPMPEGMDPNDSAQFNEYVAGLPVAALLLVILAHLGQSFVGGLVAARIAATRPMVVALIIGALTLLGGILNMMSIEHPTWMYIEVPLYIVVAWAAGRLEIKRRAKKAKAV
jgi:hypothetical protein